MIDKSKITRLAFYDFDGCLSDSPMPADGMGKWSEYHGKPYPYKGWWSKVESLDDDVFDIQLKEEVFSSLIADNDDESCVTFLLTSRLPRLEVHIKKILKKHGAHLDHYFFKHFLMEKDERILDTLNEYPFVDTIDVWDDRDKELARFFDMKEKLDKKDITVNVHVVHSDQTGIYADGEEGKR